MSKVMRIGNSVGITLPSYICTALGIERGDYMVFAVYNAGVLTARKMTPDELCNLKPAEILT